MHKGYAGNRVKTTEATNSVVEMTSSASVLGSEFDDFLFAPIGEDRNELPLSVLSALARLDVDPWAEAAKLDRLPTETATQRLASMIAALPDVPSANLAPLAMAARLTALLPRRANPSVPPHKTLLDADATKFRVGIFMYMIFIAFMLGSQWIVASRQPLAQVQNAGAQAASTVSRQIPTPNSGP